jgi:tripartite-type tricarboxylate transporter receptor subunit TctC
VLKIPDVVQRLSAQGAEPRSSTPEELARFIEEDTRRLAAVIRFAGIRGD